jgi:predicted carbohydrate-binding protein with CBM5 and CBM33 domain
MSVKHETMGIVFALGMNYVYYETASSHGAIKAVVHRVYECIQDHLCSDVMAWEREQPYKSEIFSPVFEG